MNPHPGTDGARPLPSLGISSSATAALICSSGVGRRSELVGAFAGSVLPGGGRLHGMADRHTQGFTRWTRPVGLAAQESRAAAGLPYHRGMVGSL